MDPEVAKRSVNERAELAAQSASDALIRILTLVKSHVEYFKECGIEGVPIASLSTAPDSGPLNKVQDRPLPQRTDQEPGVAGGKVEEDQARTLADLQGEIGDCQLCRLCQSRTHIVFGVGNPEADLAFIGEAPGRDEDIKGEPFVGRAGQLLTEIITKGMGIRREEVYIANVVKCRPPENRNPEPEEIAACEPFLVKQLELIRPRVIVALGTFAAQTLLKTRMPISRLRGVWHAYHGIKVMPTFHPAYQLRNPQDKKIVWKDIQEVMRELGMKSTVRSKQSIRQGMLPASPKSSGDA